jgi:DNA mismatch repair protein MutS
LFAAAAEPEHPPDLLASSLASIDPDSLTPREALEALYRLKRLASEQGS